MRALTEAGVVPQIRGISLDTRQAKTLAIHETREGISTIGALWL
jgi:hypothetical protein